ncbi:hypothetical protein EMIHUDRAFT_205089 [Emiliania huxleyi CCMP1516]|uniref:Uncharacterized protein n=2 Tax=Emiliania huxleyi TaxID=2903 RepID=A0A0D3JUF8_EMIH1|nr:hypothetical protein EMIHUDRAFT_205089 [Emiliania huxleyi CCMP1516]EOD27143.1 hypothetical protein EMIHUDRAFT_205089 [Emiliania huxleyi CCMP1516]|eukprot:XP_005779572.1 hypothetical protein EMIHUDRAFT_205089 [Emiliania huxleyi CCMP1516]
MEYALHIASIPFRVSTSLKPSQQLNRSLTSSLSWIHLCTAPVAASATICKFLVTPAPSDMRYPQRLQRILGVGCRLGYFADRRPRLRSRYSEEPSGLLPKSLFPRQAPLSKCAIVALGGFSSSSVHCCAAFRAIGHSGSRFSAALALLAASLRGFSLYRRGTGSP